jgi:hypothetical protein
LITRYSEPATRRCRRSFFRRRRLGWFVSLRNLRSFGWHSLSDFGFRRSSISGDCRHAGAVRHVCPVRIAALKGRKERIRQASRISAGLEALI